MMRSSIPQLKTLDSRSQDTLQSFIICFIKLCLRNLIRAMYRNVRLDNIITYSYL